MDYSITAIADESRGRENSTRKKRIRRLIIGAPFGDALRSFGESSPHWRRSPSMKDSVMMFPARETENLKPTSLKRWKATALGAGQQLFWREDPTECPDPAPVCRIVRNIKRSAKLKQKRDARRDGVME